MAEKNGLFFLLQCISAEKKHKTSIVIKQKTLVCNFYISCVRNSAWTKIYMEL